MDTSDQTAVPVRLPPELVTGTWGTTRDEGYVCVLPPSSLLYLSDSLEAQQLYPLTLVHDGHSVTYHEGKCYIVSTGTDSIVEFSPRQGERVFWRMSSADADTIHLNSILWRNDNCLVTAFGPKTGDLWRSAKDGYVLNVSTGERIWTGV